MSNRVLNFVNDEKFPELFITELGWSMPKGMASVNVSSEQDGETYALVPVANYQGLTAWVCRTLPKRAVRTEISKILSTRFADFVLIFTDGENQVWGWPSVNESRLSFRRLTAQHHRVGDKNDALARRVDRFHVDPTRSVSVSELLIAVKNGFDTDTEAALRIADLHSKLLTTDLDSTSIEIFLTRLLFLFFGEDTDLFALGPYDASVAFQGTVAGGDEFRNLILKYADGRGFQRTVGDLFVALRTPISERRGLTPDVADFPYVNGGLFHDEKPVPEFDPELTELLLACSNLDWSDISPAIFGSMFEGLLESTIKHVVNADEGYQATRRQLGAHYTSEENILKVIRPLFLDDLQAELSDAGNDVAALEAFHKKISSLTFFDPACGCGNFLVVTYKELREIENTILERMLSVGALTPEQIPGRMTVKIDQFFGIEISKSASAVAQVALWITDHQMNVETFQMFGAVRHSIPLTETPGIVRGDALSVPWESVIRPSDCDFIIGNPPYLGKGNQEIAQKAALVKTIRSVAGSSIRRPRSLDFVTGWIVKSISFLKASSSNAAQEFQLFEKNDNWGESNHHVDRISTRLLGTSDTHGTRVALVATNSICQGQHVTILWPWIFSEGVSIQFAHRTFKWTNDNPGAANVFCVIVGLGLEHRSENPIFDHSDKSQSAPRAVQAKEINAYLEDAPSRIVESRSKPFQSRPPIYYGNQPIDGGNLLLSRQERDELILAQPGAEDFIRPFLGAREFLQSTERFCLWFDGLELAEVEALVWPQPYLDATRTMRSKSKSATPHAISNPHLFVANRHTGKPYVIVPRVSSEDRPYVPIAYVDARTVTSDSAFIVPELSKWDFALLTSRMHNAWMRSTGGRLKGDYRYSNTLTYNTFPWPKLSDEDRDRLEAACEDVLVGRNNNSNMTLAQMYSPKTMPPDLMAAHQRIDEIVDDVFSYRGPSDDLARFEFLFLRYQELASSES
jgi:hypothetical protein